MSLRAIAAILGVTAEWVRQIELRGSPRPAQDAALARFPDLKPDLAVRLAERFADAAAVCAADDKELLSMRRLGVVQFARLRARYPGSTAPVPLPPQDVFADDRRSAEVRLAGHPDSVLAPDALPAVVRWELTAPDVHRARAFYADVFGWTISEPGPLPVRLTEVATGAGSLPGMLGQALRTTDPDAGHRRQGLILYVKVHDVVATLAAVVARGGRTVWGPTEVAPAVWLAQFEDPDGVRLGLTS